MFCSKYRKFTAVPLLCRQMATLKRFYRKTNILSNGEKYEITLDQRKLKTPKGHVLEIKNKQLALAVAMEWDSQVETINRSNMHLTALCTTMIDNPHNHTKQEMVDYVVNYLQTDTILFHSNQIDELYLLQVEKWDPLIQWFCDRYQVDITKTQSLNAPIVPIRTKELLTKHLLSFSDEAICGFMYGVDIVKSVILTLAVSERVVNVEEAVALSRLEEEYQISHWGNVEWSHELAKNDLQARMAAAALFIHLNSAHMTTRAKADHADLT